MDFIIIKEKEELLSQRSQLVSEKDEIDTQIKSLAIAAGVAGKYNSGILLPHIIKSVGEDKFHLRNQLCKQKILIESKITPINKRLKEIHALEDKDYSRGDIIKDIIKEVLTEDQFELIIKEMHNRENGLAPTKVSIGLDNSVNNKLNADKYRKLAKDSIDMLISVRRSITSVIDDGCKRFDKGYFIQCISPLNRTIPTLSDLDKTKRLNHLN